MVMEDCLCVHNCNGWEEIRLYLHPSIHSLHNTGLVPGVVSGTSEDSSLGLGGGIILFYLQEVMNVSTPSKLANKQESTKGTSME